MSAPGSFHPPHDLAARLAASQSALRAAWAALHPSPPPPLDPLLDWLAASLDPASPHPGPAAPDPTALALLALAVGRALDPGDPLRTAAEAAIAASARARGEVVLPARVEVDRIRRAIAAHPDFLSLFDTRRRLLYASPSLLATWGKPLGDVIGKGFLELGYPPSVAAHLDEHVGRALDGRTARGVTSRIDADGRTRHFEFFFVPVRGPDGSVDSVAGSTRDVTEQKKSEESALLLAELSRRLTERLGDPDALGDIPELLAPAVADVAALVVFGDDGDGVDIAVHGRDRARTVATEDALDAHPDLPGALARPLLAFGRTRDGGTPMDAARALFGDISLDSALVLPLTARGQLVGAVLLAMAGSGRHHGPEDLELAREVASRAAIAVDHGRLLRELHRSVRQREDVLAIVSHDLRSPLGAISLSAGTLGRRLARLTPAVGGPQLDVITRAVARMERLIADLLDRASIEAGRLAVSAAPEPLGPILDEAFAFHAPLALERQVTLLRDAAPDAETCTVVCDRQRTLQALANLLGNALKFTPPGGTIVLGAHVSDGCAALSVRDDGPGIAEDELPRVFEPYWSAPRHARHGSGLGLYVTRGIAVAQGGSVRVTSAPGEGTTVTLIVPVATEPDETVA